MESNGSISTGFMTVTEPNAHNRVWDFLLRIMIYALYRKKCLGVNYNKEISFGAKPILRVRMAPADLPLQLDE